MSSDIEISCLKKKYHEQAVPALREKSKYANVIQVPGLTKIVVSMGIGEVARDSRVVDGAVHNLTMIAGQKPTIIRARKSIAQFRLHEGIPIGHHITPRGNCTWEFVDRLLTLTLLRIRDSRGLNGRQFDGKGNYTSGLNEQVIFLEVDQDKIDRVRDMGITLVISAASDQEGRALLKHLGSPLKAVDDPKPVKGSRGPAFQPRKKR